MGSAGAVSGPEKARKTEAPQPVRDPRRRLLRAEDRLLGRMLPCEFPPWKTVCHWFRAWKIDGTFERMNPAARQRLRVHCGRDPQPSAGPMDNQSAKTTGVGDEARGYGGGRKVHGRKRHILLDTEGLVVTAKGCTARRFPTRTG